jgi:hypothetical protein
MNKKFMILLAALALITSTLACGAPSEPTLSNLRTAKDANGEQVSSVFSTTDTIYAVGDLANGIKGNVVSSKWMVSSVEGYEAGYVIDEVDLTLDEDKFAYSLNFFFEPPVDGWPVGSYNVEIYFNGVLHSTLAYTVE